MFKILIQGVEKVRDYLRGVIWRFHKTPDEIGERIASVYLNVLQANCPVVTGTTRDRIRIIMVDSTEEQYRVTIGLPGYLFVAPGTIIRPSRAKALCFYWERVGKVVFFASVTHPGVGGGPGWIHHTLAGAKGQTPSILRQASTLIIQEEAYY